MAVGGALRASDPGYGQGLTAAVLEAELLDGLLWRRRVEVSGLNGLSRAYLRGATRLIQVPWTWPPAPDLTWPAEDQPPSARRAHSYNRHVFALDRND